jgi:dipeptidyl aminopeptidase/acylaminoacyl peptidase
MATIEQTPETRVDVAVPIYGVYDLTNRMGVQSKQFVPLLMEPLVMQAKLADEPERFAAASPMDLVREGLPPFVVVQGDMDTLAPVEEARAFVDQLRGAGTDVSYMEFPGAQHVFDLGYSYQSSQMIEGVLSLLEAKRTGR